MDFKTWLEARGVEVTVTQEDDGSGYECLEIVTMDGARYELTVQT